MSHGVGHSAFHVTPFSLPKVARLGLWWADLQVAAERGNQGSEPQGTESVDVSKHDRAVGPAPMDMDHPCVRVLAFEQPCRRRTVGGGDVHLFKPSADRRRLEENIGCPI